MASYSKGDRYNQVFAEVDGREMSIDTQYGVVIPLGTHPDHCDQVAKMGGICSCGLLDGIDTEALIAGAIEWRRAERERSEAPTKTKAAAPEQEWTSPRGLTLTEEMDREDTAY